MSNVRDRVSAMAGQGHLGKWGLARASFDPERRYRYRLSRVWDRDLPIVVWVMLNPSTADAFRLDPTIRRVLAFSRDWGFGGVVVVNLFALRATHPRALLAADDPTGPHNDHAIARAADSADQIALAWGNSGTLLNRAEIVLSSLAHRQDNLLSLGVTKTGQPRHPLYVHGSVSPRPWSG